MEAKDRNQGLSKAQKEVYPTFDECPKLCGGTLMGAKPYGELAELAIQKGVNPDHCVRGIDAVIDGVTQTVPCPYGQSHSGFTAAMASLLASREG